MERSCVMSEEASCVMSLPIYAILFRGVYEDVGLNRFGRACCHAERGLEIVEVVRLLALGRVVANAALPYTK